MKTSEIEPGVLKGGGYLALPDAPGPHPGVVVIHEAYGLNDNIKDIAGRFAGEGYAALAVDLFTGRNRAICMTRYMTGMLIGSVDRYGISDLKAALTHLAAMPEVDPERIGAIGFCMGGGFAIAWACTDRRLKAIAPFYGANPRPLDAVKRACPVVGSYPRRTSPPAPAAPSTGPSTPQASRTTSRSIPARATRSSTTEAALTTSRLRTTHGHASSASSGST